MSRIGKKPIQIPDSVEVKIDNKLISVKGPKGELQREIRPEIEVILENKEILVKPCKETKQTKAFWGLTRALISNMIIGVEQGYEKKLQMEGIGYKANLEEEGLILQVGFSHPVKIEKVEGIKFSVEKNIITISGIDKEKVGQAAAKIRRVRPPEPYKGRGIRYLGEQIRRKVGKRVAGTEQ